jgi:hypothetical protein
MELEDKCGMCGVNKDRRLRIVHSLIKVVVEEGVLHVKLMDRPGVGGSNAEDDLNHSRPNVSS